MENAEDPRIDLEILTRDESKIPLAEVVAEFADDLTGRPDDDR